MTLPVYVDPVSRRLFDLLTQRLFVCLNFCINYSGPAGVSLPGDHMPGVPPVPIPNTAVKPRAANGSRTLGPARVGRCQVFGPGVAKAAPGPFYCTAACWSDVRRVSHIAWDCVWAEEALGIRTSGPPERRGSYFKARSFLRMSLIAHFVTVRPFAVLVLTVTGVRSKSISRTRAPLRPSRLTWRLLGISFSDLATSR